MVPICDPDLLAGSFLFRAYDKGSHDINEACFSPTGKPDEQSEVKFHLFQVIRDLMIPHSPVP